MKDILRNSQNSQTNGFIDQSKVSVDGRTDYGSTKQKSSGNFSDKTVIITGASSGIGKALAFHFAKEGARVVLAARNKQKLQEIARMIRHDGGVCTIIETDVTKHHDCYYLIDKTLDIYGKIDILINNAGISMRAAFNDTDVHVLEQLMNTNFWGAVYCSKYALPHLLESKGSLVSISSISGITPLPGRSGYVASKHALDGFMNTLRIEHLKDGLQVLVVHPGFTTSDIRNRALNKDGVSQSETPRNEKQMMSAEDVAEEVGNGILHKKHDLVLTWEGKLISWLYKRAPRLSDKLLHWEMSKEPDSPF